MTRWMIGQTMFVSGMVMFATAPIAGQLVERFDPRFVLIAGFVFFAIGTWQMTYVTSDYDFWELLWPQVFRGVGLMFAIIPVTNTSLGTLAADRVKNASGLFNLMRNLGGAIGLAAINTWFNDRMDLHLQRLHEAVNCRQHSGDRDAVKSGVALFGVQCEVAGAGGTDGDGAIAGRGHELCRRVSDADGTLPRPGGGRPAHETAGCGCRRWRRALIFPSPGPGRLK